MPGGDLAELRRIYQQAGRPGAAKLKDAAKRQGLNLTVKEVKEFVIGEAVSQVYQAAPHSEGKITSPELNARWMVDLIDYKTKGSRRTTAFDLLSFASTSLVALCTQSRSRPRSKRRSLKHSSESRESLGEGLWAKGGPSQATSPQTPVLSSKALFRKC
jgi:hypothetical protein